jgi:hypothetical protein
MEKGRPSGEGHPIATALAWVFGLISAALTAILGWAAVDTVVSWSTYVGGEKEVVLVILGFLGALTALAWLATLIAARARRG